MASIDKEIRQKYKKGASTFRNLKNTLQRMDREGKAMLRRRKKERQQRFNDIKKRLGGK